MDYSRMIKLLLPSGNLINLQLGGEEKELKDLLSTITKISPNQIKGIKDSRGNYYTISSALNSVNIISNSSDYFELIYNKQYQSHSKQVSCPFPFDDYYQCDSHHQIILNTTPNVGNYYANYIFEKPSSGMIKTINKQKPKIMGSSSNTIKSKNGFYLQLLRQLYDETKINEKMYISLKNLINNNSEEVIAQLDLYSKGKIHHSTLIQLLSFFAKQPMSSFNQNVIKEKDATDIIINDDTKEDKESLIASLEEYFDSNDFLIVQNMARYENEMVMTALADYSQFQNKESLAHTISQALVRYKTKSQQRKKPNSSISLPNCQKSKTPIKSKSLVQSSHHIMSASKSTSSQKERSMVLIKIRNFLNFINKVIFEYIQIKHSKELENIVLLYQQNTKNDTLSIILNEQCNKILKTIILNDFLSQKEFNYLQSLINENDQKVNNIFSSFRKGKFILNDLKRDISDLLKSNTFNKNINNNPSLQIPTLPIDSKIINIQLEQEETEQDKIQAFLMDLEAIIMSEKDKEKILEMVNKKDNKLYAIINSYVNGKAPENLKDKINKLTQKKHFGTILTKLELHNNSPKKAVLSQLKQTPSPLPLSKQNSKTSTTIFQSFKDCLSYLETESIMTSDKLAFLKEHYNKKNLTLTLLWDKYVKTTGYNEFIEGIFLFLQKEYVSIPTKKKDTSSSHNSKDNVLAKTPETVKQSKSELIIFLKNINQENEEMKKKKHIEMQNEVITVLYKEKYIKQNTYNAIRKLISQYNQRLIVAFEVYAVTKNQFDFIETLKIFEDFSENYKGLFYTLLNQSDLQDNEKRILINLYEQKDSVLLSALEYYDGNNDKEDLYDTFKTICNKNKDKY